MKTDKLTSTGFFFLGVFDSKGAETKHSAITKNEALNREKGVFPGNTRSIVPDYLKS